jgi:hypothetical protein
MLSDAPFSFDDDAFGAGGGPEAADGAPLCLCGRLAAFFNARPGEWIDGMELGRIAGSYAWRTRVSDLRRPPYNLTIENRQRRQGRRVVSEYRLSLNSDPV